MIDIVCPHCGSVNDSVKVRDSKPFLGIIETVYRCSLCHNDFIFKQRTKI